MEQSAGYGGILEELAIAAAQLATLCDHLEHVEAFKVEVPISVADQLFGAAASLGALEGLEPIEAYARRLDAIEAAAVVDDNGGGSAVRAATTWRHLQLAQIDHDRRFHPDVIGLARLEQLRHYAFHVAKLAGALARRLRGEAEEEIRERRLPDIVLFAIKLWTVTARRLPDTPVHDDRGSLLIPQP